MQTEIQDDGLLAQAAALAGATIAIVRHSGRRGTHQEFDALLLGLEAARAEYPDNPYVQALLTSDTREQIAGFAEQYAEVPKQNTVNDFKMAALNRCGQAAEWLAAHASPEAAAEVKAGILLACRRVAAESSESEGFTPGVDNTDDFEEGAIAEVMRALGVQSPL